jgi:hypothetical protein
VRCTKLPAVNLCGWGIEIIIEFSHVKLRGIYTLIVSVQFYDLIVTKISCTK